jgi:hypothetical protein
MFESLRGKAMRMQVLGILVAGLALAVPGTAAALQGCSTEDCTYIGIFNNYPGHCGPHDTDCYCFAEAGGEQEQASCDGEIETL